MTDHARERFIRHPYDDRPIGETTEPTEIERLQAEIAALRQERDELKAHTIAADAFLDDMREERVRLGQDRDALSAALMSRRTTHDDDDTRVDRRGLFHRFGTALENGR